LALIKYNLLWLHAIEFFAAVDTSKNLGGFINIFGGLINSK